MNHLTNYRAGTAGVKEIHEVIGRADAKKPERFCLSGFLKSLPLRG
jgi:hypothetical protein